MRFVITTLVVLLILVTWSWLYEIAKERREDKP